jgi:hypothetical protein
VYGYAVGISHAVTAESWVTSMDIDVPALAATTTADEPALQQEVFA